MFATISSSSISALKAKFKYLFKIKHNIKCLWDNSNACEARDKK